MRTYETTSRTGPDGTLTLTLPADLADTDVRITVEPAANGRPAAAPADQRPQTREQWREFVRTTRGSIPDFPDVERPGPEAYERKNAATERLERFWA